jgi:hypothetical protein
MSRAVERRVTLLALNLVLVLLLSACAEALPEGEERIPSEVTEQARAEQPTTRPTEEMQITETPGATNVEPTEEAQTSSTPEADGMSEYEIVTLLPPDAIPSIDEPHFYSAEEADAEYEPSELILGVEFDGEARAYSVGVLSRHEIVNDIVGGHSIAVTW